MLNFARLVVLAVLLVGTPGMVGATCRQALVFALDVSSSVDETEYRQQLDGLAGALEDPLVLGAVLDDPDYPMAVAVFEWSSTDYSSLIVDWTVLGGENDVAGVAGRLRTWARGVAPSETGLGAGLRVAAALLARAPECWEHTIDISADGRNNDGPSPLTVHEGGELLDTTVNALLIGSAESEGDASDDLEDLRLYLRENVVRGPGSFVAVAQSYDDYTAAMRRKLLKEIASLHGGR